MDSPPEITSAKVIITLLLLIAACCTAGLFMVTLGSNWFWGMLVGAVAAGAGAMLIPLERR